MPSLSLNKVSNFAGYFFVINIIFIIILNVLFGIKRVKKKLNEFTKKMGLISFININRMA